jgi:hypothetical protein
MFYFLVEKSVSATLYFQPYNLFVGRVFELTSSDGSQGRLVGGETWSGGGT